MKSNNLNTYRLAPGAPTLALACCLATSLTSLAASLTVTNLADSGPGTLRAAVTFANTNADADTITFDAALSGKTNLLTSGPLTVSNSLTIDASALPASFKVSGNHSSRIFEISAGATVTLNSLFLMNGYVGSGDSGGAIRVDSGATLTLNSSTVSSNSASGIGGGIANFAGVVIITNCTLSGNAASYAGAIENESGMLTIIASTLSDNVATNNGGAIDNDAGATLRLINSTLSGNLASFGGGGGIENYQASAILNNSTISGNSAGGAGGINNYGTLAMTNTIVAGNTAPFLPNINFDSSGSFSGANNLTDGDPRLAQLGNYGGPTLTMPPQPGSPAIDGGLDSVTNFLATDQRGTPRQYVVHVDIGAVESEILGVSNLNDSGPGSLRDTIASGQSVVGFAANLSGGTLTLTNGQISLANNVTIDVSPLPNALSISGNNSNRIFEVNPGATVTLVGLELLNGNAGSGAGGAIRVDAGGTLTVISAWIHDNSANDGGGIDNYGTLTLESTSVEDNRASNSGGGIENNGGTLTIRAGSDVGYNSATYGGGIANRSASARVNVIQSTIWYNQATNNAGGIANTDGSVLGLINSTVSGNSAGGAGGGIEALQATITSVNSTVSGNSAASAGGINNYGTLAFTNTIVAGNIAGGSTNIYTGPGGSFSGANNLTNGNPLLAALDVYGAWPPTCPLLHDSPALDAGLDSVTNFLATDARGYARLSGGRVDIGAVEAQWAPAANPPLLTNPGLGSDGAFGFSFTNIPIADFTVLTSTNVALPLGQWSILGAPVQYPPGQYTFIDSGATNYPRRFYQVVSP